MRKHFSAFSKPKLMALTTAALLAALALPAFANDGIKAVRDASGKTVYVNREESPAPAPVRRYVYWSHVKHRWVLIPTPSRRQVSQARTAAREVSAIVAAAPAAAPNASVAGDPDTRSLLTGRSLSQERLDQIIDDAAAHNNVDPSLVRALIKVESNFNPHAVSRKGAIGLMQLMPRTARELNVNPYDPAQNVEGGVRHLKGLLDSYNGDVPLSLAAYNAGAGAVARNGGVPPYQETRNYVRKITDLYGPSHPFNNGGRSFTSIKVSHDSEGHLMFSNE